MKTLQECIDVIEEFATKHNLKFEQEGTIGRGYKCIGLKDTSDRQWYIGHNPVNDSTGEYLSDFYCQEFEDIFWRDAYYTEDYLAVLGRGEEAIRRLCAWIESLNELGVEVVRYKIDYDVIDYGFQREPLCGYAYTLKKCNPPQ